MHDTPCQDSNLASKSDLPVKTARVRARTAAPGALAWFQRADAARVLHVFDAACNLVDAGNELLSLILDPGQMDPFAIAVEAPQDWPGFLEYVDADSPVVTSSDHIQIAALHVWIGEPTHWNSRPDWGVVREGLSGDLGWLTEIKAQLQQKGSKDSLAALVGYKAGTRHGSRPPWWVKATEPVGIVLDGLGSRNRQKLTEGAASLAGLGPGLTPAGDDFLIGLIYAIHSVLDPREAESLCGLLHEAACSRTGIFSAAHIKAASRGEAAAHWQKLLAACVPGEQKQLSVAIDRLLAVGHSSGEDAISGFLLGMLTLLSRRE